MKVIIKYFASLKEKAQKSDEEIEVFPGESLSEIYQTLSGRYHFALSAREVKFAVNNEYADDRCQIKAGDTIVFIPPVAGG